MRLRVARSRPRARWGSSRFRAALVIQLGEACSAPIRDSSSSGRTMRARGRPTIMRSEMFLFGATVLAATALGCSGSPQAQQSDATSTTESPLETTGQVQFYIEVTGAKEGAFKGETILTKYPTYIPAFQFGMTAQTPVDSATGEATGKTTWTP